MEDFLAFRRMLTPIIVQTLFWVFSAISVLMGIAMLSAPRNPFVDSTAQTVLGLIFLFAGPLMIRVYCELLILFFRMNETLTEIRNTLTAGNSTDPVERPQWRIRADPSPVEAS
jgi:hypothetical protein